MASTSAAKLTEDLLRGLECAVCQEHFREPRMLPCGHTFCLTPCLEGVVGQTARRKFVKCPECRTASKIPKEGIKAFPVNVAIARQTASTLKRSFEEANGDACPICGEDEDNLLKCTHCNVFICESCRIEHTPLLHQRVCELAHEISQEAVRACTECVLLENEALLCENKTADLAPLQIDKYVERIHALVEHKARDLKQRVQVLHQDRLAQTSDRSAGVQRSWNSLKQLCEETLTNNGDQNIALPHVKLAKAERRLLTERQKVSEASIKTMRDLRCEKEQTYVVLLHFEPLVDAIQNFRVLEHKPDQPLAPNQVPVAELDNDLQLVIRKSSVLDSASKIKLRIGASDGTLADLEPTPSTVAIDVNRSTSDILIVRQESNLNYQVCRFDSTGKLDLSLALEPDQFVYPYGLVSNRRGQMMISDYGKDRVTLHNRDGSLLRVFGCTGAVAGCFNHPSGLAIDARDRIHVCDTDNNRVQVFSQAGQYISQYEPRKTPKFLNPSHISISMRDDICIGAAFECLVLNKGQEFVSSWKMEYCIAGLCFANDLHVLVSDRYNNRVHVYNLKGEALKVFEAGGADLLHRPRSLAVDSQGDIYIACGGSVLKI